jgi:hypothetical protein
MGQCAAQQVQQAWKLQLACHRWGGMMYLISSIYLVL